MNLNPPHSSPQQAEHGVPIYITVTPTTSNMWKVTQGVADTSSSALAPRRPLPSSFEKLSTVGKVDIRVLGINLGICPTPN